MVGSGDTFVQAMRLVLRTVDSFVASYVDDSAVHSDSWESHLKQVDSYLSVIQNRGFTLGLAKCECAKPTIKFVGHIIGSGKRRLDTDRVYSVIGKLCEPGYKKQLRKIFGFFSYWREYLQNFSEVAKPLTDLTVKRVPNQL